MNKSFSDSAIYGGSVQEHRRNRGSYTTSGELVTRISLRESLAGEFVHYPLYKSGKGSRLSLGFLPSQLEGPLSRRKEVLGESHKGATPHSQRGSEDY